MFPFINKTNRHVFKNIPCVFYFSKITWYFFRFISSLSVPNIGLYPFLFSLCGFTANLRMLLELTFSTTWLMMSVVIMPFLGDLTFPVAIVIFTMSCLWKSKYVLLGIIERKVLNIPVIRNSWSDSVKIELFYSNTNR